MARADDAYLNYVTTVGLSTPCTLPHLAACVRDIVIRHEVLRSRVDVADGRPFQEVLTHGEVAIEVSTASTDDVDTVEAQLTADLSATRLDLTQGTMMRVGAVLVGEEVRRVVLAMSHVAVDDGAATILAPSWSSC